MAVGLVVVSHVAELADGVRVLATQMAPDVAVVAAGGTDDGRVGTSFDKVVAALAEADTGAGVVVIYDLGSAQMTAEMAIELLDPEAAERVRLVEAPLVEGAVTAATTAQGGTDLEAVAAAARTAPGASADAEAPQEKFGEDGAWTKGPAAADATVVPADAAEPERATVVLRNPAGMHARPAGQIANLVKGYDARVRLGRPDASGSDATSVLAVVALGIRTGGELEVTATGPDARAVVAAVAELAEEGFGEFEQAPPEAWVPPAKEYADTGSTASTASTASAAGADEAAADGSADGEPGVLRGTVAAEGIGIGPVRHLRRTEPELPEAGETEPSERAAGRERLTAAIGEVDAALALRTGPGGAESEIAAAHRALLADPALGAAAGERIDAGEPVERAWWASIGEAREVLAAGAEVAAERAADVEDLGRQVLEALGVAAAHGVRVDELADAVVVAAELLPSDVRELAAARVAGVALAGGGRTSHASIIAAGLGVPLIVQLGPRLLEVPDGTTVICDALSGAVQIDPPGSVRFAVKQRRDQLAEERARLRGEAVAPVVRDGRSIRVEANVAGVDEAHASVEAGADGVGLLRTELLYVDRPDLPGEDEQVAELGAILRALDGRPATVRTLDVGGDKLLPALRLDPWRHGPLGVRGLRYFLRHPEILRTQLRAVLRAAALEGVGPVGLMVPMVTVPSDVVAFRTTIDDVVRELKQEGIVSKPPAEVGVMIEVPAAAFAAYDICVEVDFVSVGSNDLQQYLMAADRTNEEVSAYDLPEHPALWRAIEEVTAAGRRHDTRVAVCGTLGADPTYAARLADLGVGELSMTPAAVPTVKAALRERTQSAR